MKPPEAAPGHGRKNFMDEAHRLSILISTCIILCVQLTSLAVLSYFTIRARNLTASTTADEIRIVLAEPLYNVDDPQAIRIAEALLSSGRIAGIVIESTATGRILDKPAPRESRWFPPQSRDIEYAGIPLGRVELYFSDREFAKIMGSFLVILLVLIGAVLAANYLAHYFLSRKRGKRVLDELTAGINEIAAGRYDRKMGKIGYRDIDAIIGLMNDMSSKVQSKNEELVALNDGLERRVAERTAELKTAFDQQRLLQDKLIQTGKLTALGQLSAGIAHELNTPIGAIISSNQSLAEIFDAKADKEQDFLPSLDPAERSLHDEIIRLGFQENRTLGAQLPGRKAAQEIIRRLEDANIAGSEEIAAKLLELGLSGRVSEILPLLATNRKAEIIAAAGETVLARRMIAITQESAQRAASVVSAFRSYLSPDKEEGNQIVDVPRDIREVLTLMHNMLKHGIDLTTKLDPVTVRGSSDKLSQVWMNLIRNAAQAMEFSGALEVSTALRDGMAVVSVIDSGPGIADAIRGRIFEPFFTTKKHGEGMGLGLDICKKIVEAHHGTIAFESSPGRTAFIVSLPALSEVEREKEAAR